MNEETPNESYQFVVLCLDRKTGKTLWQKIAREAVPHEGHQQNNTYASASPVTDGQLVVAFFGSRGLHCYDFDGNLKWSKDFGQMRTKMGFGEGASPALYGDTVVVNWDHEGDDFIVALDKRTGKELWRTPRDEGTGWSTPLVVEHGGKQQVIVNATGKVRSYDLATGKEIWSCAGQTANAIPTPVADAGTVYVTSGFRGNALYAIALGRTGDLAGTDAIRWQHDKNTPYVPSPLLVDDLLYLVANTDAKLSCFDAQTGNANFEGERLEGLFAIYASPVSAKDRIYVLGREGTCLVLKKGPRLEILATNKLDDKTDASIALAGNELFLRGRANLYCIGEK
jgi:outer membrane protein assembly factor BamB